MNNAITGIRKLLENDFSDFNYSNDIKLYALLMVFCNNMDTLFKSIPEYLLEDVFYMHQIEKSKTFLHDTSVTYYDYGTGYKSNFRGSLHDELRVLRNNLAHGNYKYQNGTININTNALEATFDIKWLESLVLVGLSNNNYDLCVNMSDVMLLCLVNPIMYKSSDIKGFANDGKVVFIKLTAKISDKEKIMELLNARGLKKERITFDLLKSVFMNEVQDILKQFLRSSAVLKDNLAKTLLMVEKRFNGIIKAEVVKIDDKLLSDSSLYGLSSGTYLQYLIDSEIKKEKFKKNIIDLTDLLNILDKLNEGKTLSQDDYIIFEGLKEFLIRVYGYIVFNEMGLGKEEETLLDEYLKTNKLRFSMAHARNIWKEYIKRIKKSIEELKQDKDKYRELDICYTLFNLYHKKLDILENGKERILLTSLIRNAIIHDYINLVGDEVFLFDREPVISLYKKSSKSNEITLNEFGKKEHTFEAMTTVNDFKTLLDLISESKIDELKR